MCIKKCCVGIPDSVSAVRHAVRVGVRVADVDAVQQLQAANGRRRRLPL